MKFCLFTFLFLFLILIIQKTLLKTIHFDKLFKHANFLKYNFKKSINIKKITKKKLIFKESKESEPPAKDVSSFSRTKETNNTIFILLCGVLMFVAFKYFT